MKELIEKTAAKHKIIKDLGYNLIVIKSCEYDDIKKYGNIDLYVSDIISKFIILPV